jgi:extracellular factor (EF) 3-hydroxypalmitic acid methyl ester biosynthesis protein
VAKRDALQAEFEFLVRQLESRLAQWERDLADLRDERALDARMPTLREDIYDHHDRMEMLVAGLDKSESHRLKQYYRERLNRFWAQGEITNRCLTRPRGYHGDFVTMRLMYENAYRGETNLGKCLHKFVTDDASSASVRGRRAHLLRRIRTVGFGRSAAIFSVASGPATEIVDALKAGVRLRRIVLLDQDQEALNDAEASIREVKPETTELALMNVEIADLVTTGDADLEALGPFEFIYSAGLYDYLPDPAAQLLNWYLSRMLAPGGLLEIGNFTDFPIGFFSDYASGWRLNLRDRDALRRMVPDGVDVEYTRIGDQTFVAMKRPVAKPVSVAHSRELPRAAEASR